MKNRIIVMTLIMGILLPISAQKTSPSFEEMLSIRGVPNPQIGSISLTAFNLAHMNQQNKDVQNIAYLLEEDGMAIFHTGDSDPKQVGRFAAKKPSEYNIDIALINGAFNNFKEFKTTSSFINADTYVGMHYPKNFFNMEHEMPDEVPDYFKEPMAFKELMEKRTFYIPADQR